MSPPRNLITERRLFWICSLPLLCRPTPFVQEKARQWVGWLLKPCHAKTALGFTLAEVLIALAILGVIATFTIPKIMVGQQNAKYNAIAKESVAMVSGAFAQVQANGTLSSTTYFSHLFPYMNYVALDTTSVIDAKQTLTTQNCASGGQQSCIRLHSGAILQYACCPSFSFGGTGTTNAIWFTIDPDGTTDGTTNGPGKAVEFWLYYNGRIATRGGITSNTCNNAACYNPISTYDPPWFSW